MAEFIPENWVIFKLGERKTLHFSDHTMVTRTLTDPLTGKQREVQSLTFQVDREGGSPVSKLLSVLSTKLAQDLSGYMPEKRYTGYEFVIEKPPSKFAAPRLVEARPIKA